MEQKQVRTAPPEPERPPAEAPGNVAVIGSSMRITGDVRSQEALYVDGQVDGSLELQHALTIGPNGKVSANVKAREVMIFGSMKGNVEVVGKIAIRGQGSLIGDIRAAGIVIDDGAYFKGSIDIVRSEAAQKPAPSKPR